MRVCGSLAMSRTFLGYINNFLTGGKSHLDQGTAMIFDLVSNLLTGKAQTTSPLLPNGPDPGVYVIQIAK